MTSHDTYSTFTKEYQAVFKEVGRVPGSETLVRQLERGLIAYDLGRVSLLAAVPGVVAANKTGNLLYAALGIATGELIRRITNRRAQELLTQGRAVIDTPTSTDVQAPSSLEELVEK